MKKFLLIAGLVGLVASLAVILISKIFIKEEPKTETQEEPKTETQIEITAVKDGKEIPTN